MIQKIVGSGLRARNRFFEKSPTINIVEQLTHATRVLVFMPSKVEEFGAALKAVEQLRKIRPKWDITVVTRMNMVSFVGDNLKVDVLPYSNQDINFVGLPKQSLKQLFREKTYDLALDFKLSFDLLSVSLIRLSKAPVRVCIDSKEKSAFYNIEIRIDPGESYTNKYNAMIKYINVMAQSGSTPEVITQPS